MTQRKLVNRSSTVVYGYWDGEPGAGNNHRNLWDLGYPSNIGIPGNISSSVNFPVYQRYLSTLQESIVGQPWSTVETTLYYSNMSTLECLTRYLTFQRDASNLVMVSSTDWLTNTPVESNNSLLVFGWYVTWQ